MKLIIRLLQKLKLSLLLQLRVRFSFKNPTPGPAPASEKIVNSFRSRLQHSGSVITSDLDQRRDWLS